jgi:hypothetical protein
MQGDLDNQFFVTVMRILARHPDFIRETLLGDNITDRINTKVGIYRVYFPGARTTVLIDDFIPVKSHGKGPTPAFSYSKQPEIWPQLLEKAWAKMFGGYLSMQHNSQVMVAAKYLIG